MAMNMEEWNELYPPGTSVMYTPEMGAKPEEAKTSGKATQPGRVAIVRLEGWPQPVWLHRVEPVVEGPASQKPIPPTRLYGIKLDQIASQVALGVAADSDPDEIWATVRAALRTAFRWGAEAHRTSPPE